MGRRALGAAVAVIVLVAATTVFWFSAPDSPGGPRVCTLIGCLDEARVDLEAAPYLPERVVRVRLCVLGRCDAAARPSMAVSVPLPQSLRHVGARVPLEVTLLDTHGRPLRSSRLVTDVSRTTPNGEGCGTCWSAYARLRRDGTVVRSGYSDGPTTTSEHGVDVISLGRVLHAGTDGGTLPLFPGTDIDLRTRERVRGLAIRYGDRVRHPWDATRTDAGYVALVSVPIARRVCGLTSVVLRYVDARGTVHRTPIPVRTDHPTRGIGIHERSPCDA